MTMYQNVVFIGDLMLKERCKFKVGLSPSKESPIKMTKNAFYFILKTFFIPKIFKFLSRLSGHVGKTA